MQRRSLLLGGGALGLAGCAGLWSGPMPPPAPREFRAAWVASVDQIDWPRPPSDSSEVIRAQIDAVLAGAARLHLNALVVQVRPAADALYASTLEPWSEYLSGVQGRATEPEFDPLAHWVSQAHARGIELHAWFNPFRARHPSARGPLHASHVARAQPQWVKAYGDMLWLDPGESGARAHSLAVVADVLRRYAVDGVHIDDYFYPYPVQRDGAALPFPDDPSWQRYRDGGGRLERADWRRDNVNRFVQELHALVRELRPQVRLGISPFGLGRPDLRAPGVQGFSQYDQLYADVEHWAAQGWYDYLAPQLYWPRQSESQAFGTLLEHWQKHNPQGRHVWPGLFSSRVGQAARPWPADEVLNQVALLRERGCSGHLHFSWRVLAEDRDGLATRLGEQAYAEAALVPATPWLPAEAPGRPQLQAADGALRITPTDGPPAWRWAVWRREGERWSFDAQPGAELDIPIAGAGTVVVSAVGATGLEGERRRWQR